MTREEWLLAMMRRYGPLFAALNAPFSEEYLW